MSKLINLRSFKNFFESSSAGGILLFICVVLALLIANSSYGESLTNILNTTIGYENSNIHLKYTLKQWIDDGLMAIFFLLVGLEIKRELVEGELASPKKAALPIFAAIGGALLPAAIYALFNHDQATAHGWGIPMATDIAFALAVISLLGSRVPASLKIFLAALAIVDDLLAILVIALFYSSTLQYTYLLIAFGLFLLQLLFNKIGIQKLIFYIVPGIFMWYFIHHSGIHATIAGVLTAMTIPTTPDDKESPLERLEHLLSKPVNFIIIPLFAFANTAILLHQEMIQGLTSSMGLGIIFGLLVGKSFGILSTCFLCVKLGISSLPEGAGWKHMFGVGLLGGIGFTMSIFVAMLSFDDALHIEEAKLAVLLTSCTAGLLGYLYLSMLGKKNKQL